MSAADALKRLAREISALNGSPIHQRINELIDLSSEVDPDFHQVLLKLVSFELRSIGFHVDYASGAVFLEWYRDEFERVLRDYVNDDDSTISAPNLAEQVENDPTVRAARQHYEKARAKAYEEARKRL